MSEWQVRRREALGLDPARRLEGLIALDEIVSDRLLEAVADQVCESAEEYGWAPFLDGGFVLLVDEQVFSRPTCCVDLREGVADWVRLSEHWPSTWTPVESGHPGVLARRQASLVEVSEQSDDSASPIVPHVVFGIAHLRAALPPALGEISLFAARLQARLAERGVDESASRAAIVAGLSEA